MKGMVSLSTFDEIYLMQISWLKGNGSTNVAIKFAPSGWSTPK